MDKFGRKWEELDMSKQAIEANIVEVNDGPYFNVTLETVPRIGELIDLHSLVDEAGKYPPKKQYEVVQVLHKIYDVPQPPPRETHLAIVAGSHFVVIFVKPSNSTLFDGIS